MSVETSTPIDTADPDLRPEYDLRDLGTGVRGKHAGRFPRGTKLVSLAPDLAAEFPTSESVDAALREVLRLRSGMSGRDTGRI